MSTELASAYVTIIPSLKGAGKTIEKALGGINTSGVGKSAGISFGGGFNLSLKSLAKGATGVLSGIATAKVLQGGISRALAIEQAQYKFRALGIDVEAAMASCNEAVDGTAYSLDAAATTATMLAASGIQAGDQMTNSLKAVAGVAAMGGSSMEEIGNIFGQVAAKGKLQGDELLQFSERGINATAALAEHLGKSQAEVRDMVSAGEIDFQTFSDAMYAAFGDAASGANETFSGALSNMKSALNRLTAKFADPALSALKDVFNAIRPAINAVSAALDPLVAGFTKVCEIVSGVLVKSLGAFTDTLTETGNPLLAFKAGIMAAFDGNAIGGAIERFKQFFSMIQGGTSVVDALKACFGDFGQYISGVFSGSMDTVKAKIASLPQPIQTVIGFFSGLGSKIVDMFSKINVGGLAVSGVFGGIVAAMLPFKGAIGGVIAKIAEFMSNCGGLGGVIAIVKSKLALLSANVALAGGGLRGFATLIGGGIKGALMGLVSPAGIVIGVIAALGAAFVYLMSTNEEFRSTIGSLVAQIGASLAPIIAVVSQALTNLASTCLPLISNAIMLIVPVIGQVITIMLQVAAALAPIITTIISVLVPILSTIIETVVTVASGIIAAVMPVISMILSAIQSAMPFIQMVITTVMTAVLGIVQLVWPAIQAIITVVASALLSVINAVMPVIKAIFENAMNIMGAVVQAVWPVIQAVITTVMNIIKSVISIVMAAINGDWSGVWEGIKSFASAVWEGIKGIVSAAIEAVKSVISNTLDAISNFWNGVWEGIKSILSDAWNNMSSRAQEGVSALMDVISSIPDKIMGFFSDAASWLLDAGSNIISGLIDGILGGLGGLGEALGGVGQFIADNKGPKRYDLRLLIPHGGWIMSGLMEGIEGSMPALESTLGSVADMVNNEASKISPFGDVDTSVSSYSRSQVEVRGDSRVSDIVDMLESYLPGMSNMQIVMDTGVVAGAVTGDIDRNLGKINSRRSKGL